MDSIGYTYLLLSVVSLIVSLVIIHYLSKKIPKWIVLILCIIVYCSALAINPWKQRSLYVVKGTIQMIGFLGGILTVIDMFRKKKD
jgi:uncharacterized membrane protein YfcA